PYQALFGTAPNIFSLFTFGCLCYLWLKPYTKNKLEPRSTPCVYLGFSTHFHSHQCFDPESSKIYFSRDVKFLEDIFSYENIFSKYKGIPQNIFWFNTTSDSDTSSSTLSCPDHTISFPITLRSPLPIEDPNLVVFPSDSTAPAIVVRPPSELPAIRRNQMILLLQEITCKLLATSGFFPRH
ncbi:hypothetical protein AABB24_020233, partial [Solanum stoloniferum]